MVKSNPVQLLRESHTRALFVPEKSPFRAKMRVLQGTYKCVPRSDESVSRVQGAHLNRNNWRKKIIWFSRMKAPLFFFKRTTFWPKFPSWGFWPIWGKGVQLITIMTNVTPSCGKTGSWSTRSIKLAFWGKHAVYDTWYKVNRWLARYSPRTTTTSQPINRAPNEPTMVKNANFGLNLVVFEQKILFLLEKSKFLLPT